MRLKTIFSLLTLLMVFFACENEFDETLAIRDSEIVTNSGNLGLDESFSRQLGFQNSLQLVSSILARLAIVDREVRRELTSLNTSTNVIQLSQLIGPDVPDDSRIKQCFTLSLIAFFNGGRPGHSVVIPPSQEDPGIVVFEDVAGEFINHILNDHCVELYFPNGINFNLLPPSNIYSTAHPLNNDEKNDGVQYRLELITGGTYVVSEILFVDSNIVNESADIMVARPKRSFRCDYSEYSDVSDFKLFLAGS